MSHTLRALLHATDGMSTLLFLLLLSLYIFAVIGVQLFGDSGVALPRDHTVQGEPPPPGAFDSFFHASLTVTVCLTGEAWVAYWRQTSAAYGKWSGLYFVALIGVASYIVLNLVVAIVISAVEHTAEEDEANEAKATKDGGGAGGGGSLARWLLRPSHSLLLFSENGRVRRGARALLGWRYGPLSLNSAVVATIVVACTYTALEDKCQSGVGPHGAGLGSDAVAVAILRSATFVSLLEMSLKIVDGGALPFLAGGWNQLDVLVVGSSVIELAYGMPRDMAPVTLRCLQLLRPLRLLSRFDGLRKAVALLGEVMPRVGHVMLVYALLLLVWSVLGVRSSAADCRRVRSPAPRPPTCRRRAPRAPPPAASGGRHPSGPSTTWAPRRCCSSRCRRSRDGRPCYTRPSTRRRSATARRSRARRRGRRSTS